MWSPQATILAPTTRLGYLTPESTFWLPPGFTGPGPADLSHVAPPAAPPPPIAPHGGWIPPHLHTTPTGAGQADPL